MELAILSSALFNKEHLFLLLEYGPDIFYNAEYRFICSQMRDMSEAGEDVCLLSLDAKLRDCKEYEKRDYKKTIQELMGGQYASIHNYSFILKQLRKQRILEKISSSSKDIFNLIQNKDISYERFIESLISQYEDLKSEKKRDGYTVQELSKMKLDELFNKANYVLSGFKSLDEKITGFFNSQLTIIAARPGRGKTSLAVQLACNIDNCILFSCEKPERDIYARMLASKAKLSVSAIKNRNLSQADLERESHEHKKNVDKYNIKIYTDRNFYVIMNKIKKECEFSKPKIIIIDYLQKIINTPGENQNNKIGHITNTLQGLALKYDIPIIILSQLSRAGEKEKRDPLLSDLRDSGNIEQDGNTIIFLHETTDNQTEIIVAKNSDGPTGTIKNIKFIKQYVSFENISHIADDINFDESKPLYGGAYD